MPLLCLPIPTAYKIVGTGASNIGYGGILKQQYRGKEKLVRFTSTIWKGPKYSILQFKKKFYLLSLVSRNLNLMY